MSAWMRKLAPLSLRRDRIHDTEFDKVKTQLNNVATALQACVDALSTVTSDYNRLYGGVRKFANDFYSLYPSDDSVRRLGESTVQNADALCEDSKDRALDDPSVASVHAIDRHIRAYLSEIRNLQKEFKKVTSSRIDYEVEVERLERAERRGFDENKVNNIHDTLKIKKNIYDTTLAALTRRLASTYDKHGHVFQAAWTAYILKLDDGAALLDKHMKSHRAYAKKIQKDVLRMQPTVAANENTPPQ